MAELASQLGNKAPGQLIRAEDWNALVAAVDGINTQLETVNTTLAARIDALTAEVGQLRTEFETHRSQVEPLLGQFFRVTLETTKRNYAIGELATLTARVTDLQGNPLDLAEAAGRPWIDFVAMWGQLRPVAGFVSQGGANDRTIAVQVNAQGIAAVQLRADHAEGFSQEDEDGIADTLTVQLPGVSTTVQEAILAASSPIDPQASQAFQFMTQAYDRVDTPKMRSFVDLYYAKNSAIVTGKLGAGNIQGWRDYRATVLAFVRGDDNPLTPDPSRGVSSTQILFRDWIGPWIVLDYLPKRTELLGDLRLELAGQVRGSYPEALDRIYRHIGTKFADQGLLGKLRGYGAVHEAMGQLPVQDPPDYLNDLVDNTRSAVGFQQAMSLAQATTAGFIEEEVALTSIGGVSTRSESRIDAVAGRIGTMDAVVDEKLNDAQERLNGLVASARQEFQAQVTAAESRFAGTVESATKGFDQRFSQVEKTVQEQNQFLLENFRRVETKSSLLEDSFSSLNGRVNSALAEGGLIQSINSRVNNVEGQLGALSVLDVNVDELRQGAQRANLLWSITQGNRNLVIERPVGDIAPKDQ